MKRILLSAVSLSLVGLLSGCGGGSGGGDSQYVKSGGRGGGDSQYVKRASSVTINDFIVYPTKLSRSEFLEALNGDDSFFVISPDDESISPIDECLNEKLYETSETFQKDSDGTLFFEVSQLDISECVSLLNKAYASVFFNKVKMSGGIDLSGKTIQEVDKYDDEVMQLRRIISLKGEGKKNGTTANLEAYIAIVGSNFDTPCVHSNPMECTKRYAATNHLKYSDGSTDNQANSSIIRTNAFFHNINDTYFYLGVADFEINDWTGTMTYTGPNTPPTFSAYSDTDSVSGTYNYSNH